MSTFSIKIKDKVINSIKAYTNLLQSVTISLNLILTTIEYRESGGPLLVSKEI